MIPFDFSHKLASLSCLIILACIPLGSSFCLNQAIALEYRGSAPAGVTVYEPFFFKFPEGSMALSRTHPGSRATDPRWDSIRQAQYLPPLPGREYPGDVSGPSRSETGLFQYGPGERGFGPEAGYIAAEEGPIGPRIPEPMVFDLVRGLGARRGELEINVLSIIPFRRGLPRYEWAPEIEYAIFDNFAVEYELPIFDTQIAAQKFAAQYTFGTGLDDAFIHGVQGIAYFDTIGGDFVPTLLYLAGFRIDETWSLFGMFGGSVGPQIFPFADEPTATSGVDLIVNLTIFAEVSERLVLAVETNSSRQLAGPSEFLFMPQVHYALTERIIGQFGIGLRDDLEGRHPEIAFRMIWER